MGIFSNTIGSPLDDVRACLADFRCADDLRETQFRDLLTKHIVRHLPESSTKREAGIHGRGTRVDLYFEYGDHDFLVTVKQGLSEQKVKVLLGECLLLAENFTLNRHPRPTHIIVAVMRDRRVKEEAFDGYQVALQEGMMFLSRAVRSTFRSSVRLYYAESSRSGMDLLSLPA